MEEPAQRAAKLMAAQRILGLACATKLTSRGFDMLGRRGEPVPNDTQGGD